MAAHFGDDDKRIAHMEIVSGDLRIRSKMIDGTFPDWRRVVPEASNTLVEIDTKQLRRALWSTSRTVGRRPGIPCQDRLRIEDC